MKPLNEEERTELLQQIEGLTSEDIESWEAGLAEDLYQQAHPENFALDDSRVFGTASLRHSFEGTRAGDMHRRLDSYYAKRIEKKREEASDLRDDFEA